MKHFDTSTFPHLAKLRQQKQGKEKGGKFSPIAILIRLASFWMVDLSAASPQYRLTREAAPMLKRSASHAFVTLVLCLATDASASKGSETSQLTIQAISSTFEHGN